jgi:hypothetical protein
MESLALAAAVVLLTVYGSGFISFGLSFIRNKVWRIITYVFATFAVSTGLWLGFTLRDGNGLVIALIPLSLGVFAIWNTTRRNSKNNDSLPPAPPNQNFS